MLESINFNTLINHVVFTMNTLLKNKEYNSELLEYLYLITTGMIMTYGDNYIDDIYTTISNVKFSNERNIKDYTDNNINYYVNPTKHNYLNRLFNVNCTFPTINFDYDLLYKKIDASNIKTLEFLTHELNFILFNKNKKYSLVNSIKYRYDYYMNSLDIDEDKNVINRIFNVLQSEEIIKNILKLKDINITNKVFKNALDKFTDIDLSTYRFEGEEILTNLFRPLYKYNEFKDIAINSIYLDDDLLEKEIDSVLGKNTFKKVCKKLENLNNMILLNNKFNNSYDLSIEYVSIRNDFINRYISKKYIEVI